MAWTEPADWATAELVTASKMNQQVRDNLGHLLSVSVPTGVILDYISDTPPAGWLICDGSPVSRTTYADLFAVIGETYGQGDGSTTFNLPDFRGRVAVGKGTQSDVDTLAKNEGESVANRRPKHYHTHTLTLPNHTHSASPSDVVTSTGAAKQGDAGNATFGVDAVTVGNPTSNPAIDGGIGPTSNVPEDGPAFLVVNKIIKT